MSKLAALLGGMTLNDLAKEVLSLQGRRGDTELAHVNKREAALLKSQGGSGTVNPNTGMQEFYDGYEGFDYPMDLGLQETPSMPQVDVTVPESYAGAEQYFAGQPTPQVGGGQTVSPPQEISGFQGAYPQAAELPPYAGAETFAPDYSRFAGAYPEIGSIAQQAAPLAQEPGFLQKAEQLAGQYPRLTKAATAAALGAPGMIRARQAGREAAQTRAEMEQMAAPIRQTGEELLGAGRRGELTAAQQQQLEVARAAARQDLARRGVTSGTAAQMAENRIQELAQRFAQQNIDNGVRLIGAANSYNAQAIQMAYKMNADANAMTQNYFTNLMRAFGALPAPVVSQQQGATYG